MTFAEWQGWREACKVWLSDQRVRSVEEMVSNQIMRYVARELQGKVESV